MSRQQHLPGTPRTPGTGCRKGGRAGYVGGRISDIGSSRPREVKKDRQGKAEEEAEEVVVYLCVCV